MHRFTMTARMVDKKDSVRNVLCRIRQSTGAGAMRLCRNFEHAASFPISGKRGCLF